MPIIIHQQKITKVVIFVDDWVSVRIAGSLRSGGIEQLAEVEPFGHFYQFVTE